MPSRKIRFRFFQTIALCTLVLAISIVILTITFPLSIFFLVSASIVTALCVWQPMIGVYGMALTYPYLNAELVFGAINVPIVDMFGLCSLLALSIRLIMMLFVRNRKIEIPSIPGLLPWVGFICIALIATTHAFDLRASLKYVARPLIFFFIVSIVVIPLIVRSRVALRYTILCMIATSFFVALYGMFGLILIDTPSLFDRRVVPFSLFGYYPLGYNHNAIADIMVTVIPLAWYIWATSKEKLSKQLSLSMLIFFTLTALLTFSRTAWLACIVEAFVLIRLSYANIIRHLMPLLATLVLAVLPLIIYMFIFSSQAQVQSSNENRFFLGEIALDMWKSYPLFGAGPGTFMSYVESNPIYIKEFGEALDAHSMLYKVLAETGTIGFIFFFSMAGMILYRLFSNTRLKGISTQDQFFLVCVFITVIGGFFFQFFQTSYFVFKLWFPVGVALSAGYVVRSLQSDVKKTMDI